MNFNTISPNFPTTPAGTPPAGQNQPHPTTDQIVPTALKSLTNIPRESSPKLAERSFSPLSSRSPSPTTEVDDEDYECEMIPLEIMLQEVKDKRAFKAILAAKTGREWREGFETPGPGNFMPDDGDTYEGEMQDNLPNGQGTLTKDNGNKYIGIFEKGSLSGPGRAVFSNGTGYIGNFTNGWCFDKCGIIYQCGLDSKDGFLTYAEIYKGGFAFNKYHGIGTHTNSYGQIYVGSFLNGKMSGEGKLTFVQGDIYEGAFVNGERTGHGKYTWAASGDIYEGAFVNGKRSGQGKYTSVNGDIYEGAFVNGKRSGQGKYTSVNRGVYEGAFENGQFHGEGRFTLNNGDIYEGAFVNGKRSGQGKFTCANRGVYEGTFVKGAFDGRGRYMFANGDVYEGEYVEGQRSGNGKYTFANGDVYEGNFLLGMMDGMGVKSFTLHGKVFAQFEGIFWQGLFLRGQVQFKASSKYGQPYEICLVKPQKSITIVTRGGVEFTFTSCENKE